MCVPTHKDIAVQLPLHSACAPNAQRSTRMSQGSHAHAKSRATSGVPENCGVAWELCWARRTQALWIPPWHNLMAMAHAELERAHVHHLGLRQAIGDAWQVDWIVKVASHHIHVATERLEVVERRLVADVARAD